MRFSHLNPGHNHNNGFKIVMNLHVFNINCHCHCEHRHQILFAHMFAYHTEQFTAFNKLVHLSIIDLNIEIILTSNLRDDLLVNHE